MPKLTRNFLKGRMNKDLDERLVPKGEYRDAQNIQINTSEGSDVGAIEAMLGNTKISNGVQTWDSLFGLTSPVVIGRERDTQNNKIYWFITSDSSNVDAILEYDESNNIITPVVVDARFGGQSGEPVLNFNENYLITGINIIDDLLFWTDDFNEPRVINISTFKAGSTSNLQILDSTTQVYNRDFIASDISVIKLNPKQALSVTAKSTKIAANPERGVGITPVTVLLKLTDSNAHPLSTGDTVTSTGTITPYISPSSAFNNKTVRLTHVATKSDGTKIKYEAIATIRNLTASEVPGQINGALFTIVSVSSNVPNAALIWDLVVIESEPIFKNNFPRFSYRWKYLNGEYSTYAPFSEPVFIPGRFDYEPENGYNLGMNDNIRKITLTFPTDSYALPPANVKEIEILYKGVDSNNIYVLDTHLTSSGSLTTFDIEKDLLGPIIESNQLLRLYDNVPRKAKSQEIIGNRIIYGNYLENYTLGDEVSITATTTNTAFTSTEEYYGQKSVKSDRTYQIGISFLDEFGRESPVFTNKEAAIEVELEHANKKNKVSASAIMISVPSWAEYYKYYIKDPSANYSNLVLDRFYDAEDGNIWLSFPSAERNKVVEGDFLMLKKAHGANDNITIDNKYKIIDIKNEAPKFIRNARKAISRTQITGVDSFSGNNFVFNGPSVDTHPHFVDSLKGGNWVQFRTTIGDKTSGIYKIRSAGPEGDASTSLNKDYNLSIVEDGFTADDAWIEAITSSTTIVELIVYENSNDLLPEFQGKFFAKVAKNASFENDIAARIGLSQYVSVVYKTNVEDDLNTVSSTAFLSRMAFRNTFADPQDAGNLPNDGDDTFDLNLYISRTFENNTTLLAGQAIVAYDSITVGSRIRFKNTDGDLGEVYNVIAIAETSPNPTQETNEITHEFRQKTVTVDRNFNDNLGSSPVELELQIVEAIEGSVNATTNPAVFETQPIETADIDIYYEATDALEIGDLENSVDLNYKNCISFGNGVESNQIRDDFNAPRVDKGVRVSTILKTPYEEERKSSSLIFGGIINSRVGVNNSNQFIAAEKITKDLNPIYGSIQKLSARGAAARGDLVVLCEDKVFKILANKDALFNADGNANLTASTNVLGQAIPFAGEYGISTQPESFASFGFRSYFCDRTRRAVLRLSADGLTVISDKGLKDYFRDEWTAQVSNKVFGSYDEYTGTYHAKVQGEQVLFSETVNGWVTRTNWVPQYSGISLNNKYYTFKNGELYVHNNAIRNNIYGSQESATVTAVLNDAPVSIKNFKTLEYQGDTGWTAQVTTDQEKGLANLANFVKREGLYQTYIQGVENTWSSGLQSGDIDFYSLSILGVGEHSGADVGLTGGAKTFEFTSDIDTAISIGDKLYFQDGNNIINLGDITAIDRSSSPRTITSDNIPQAGASVVNTGEFIFAAKDKRVNTSGIIGYYADVTFTNTSSDKSELFGIGSEVFISSE